MVVLARRSGDGRDQQDRRSDPEQILAERFAAGEIDENEYRSRLHMLRSRNEPKAGASR